MKASIFNRDLRSYILVRWLFIRLIALIYISAFVSLAVQWLGLVGSQGILPVAEFLELIAQHLGSHKFWRLPTLFWLNATDGFMYFAAWGGVILSLLVFFNVAPRLNLFLLWLLYLSFTQVGQVFWAYQWDMLLLEVGLVTIFFAPGHFLPKLINAKAPSRVVVWLLRWILFRLMFESGLVKLLSGDETWRNLTALTYHYWTQPLPNIFSWYVHQMPLWFHKISCFMMLFIELVVPFFMFFGRRARILCFFVFVGLQGIIISTGNYTFFNFLTLVLCVVLVDDDFWGRILPHPFFGRLREKVIDQGGGPIVFEKIVVGFLGTLIVFVTFVQLFPMLVPSQSIGRPLLAMVRFVEPLRSINRYGLFAIMTKDRPEIIIEGSFDGEDWKTYVFHWKPGALHQAPGFVAPHQPRLDWQMWFAALGRYQNNSWLIKFMSKVLQGSEPVLALIKVNPYPDKPPRYLRAVVYNYEFTDAATRKNTGDWWKREVKGFYCPIISLNQ